MYINCIVKSLEELFFFPSLSLLCSPVLTIYFLLPFRRSSLSSTPPNRARRERWIFFPFHRKGQRSVLNKDSAATQTKFSPRDHKPGNKISSGYLGQAGLYREVNPNPLFRKPGFKWIGLRNTTKPKRCYLLLSTPIPQHPPSCSTQLSSLSVE